MIPLEKKQEVLLAYHQHNMSQRQIALKLKMSRNTVKKYIEQDLAARQKDIRNLPVTDNYLTPPAYKKRKGRMKSSIRFLQSRSTSGLMTIFCRRIWKPILFYKRGFPM